ncbi:MAG: MmcQ/YjbR family DNA-binding protein [Pseudomonadota bacterium]
MLSFARIEELAGQFPGTQVSKSYGTPAIKVRKKLVLRMHQKEDAIVVLLNSVDEQQTLIAQDPMAFYITDHYSGYPAVLVRPTVDEGTFLALLEGAWRRVANNKEIAQYDESTTT